MDKTSADLASGGYNVPIEDAYKLNVYTNGVYRDYTWFDAFETSEDQGTVGPRTPTDANPSTTYDFGRDGGFYFWRSQDEDASQWWWRFDVYSQPYTEYQKLFTYTRTVITDETSAVPVAEGGGISRVLHWVKYEM